MTVSTAFILPSSVLIRPFSVVEACGRSSTPASARARQARSRNVILRSNLTSEQPPNSNEDGCGANTIATRPMDTHTVISNPAFNGLVACRTASVVGAP